MSNSLEKLIDTLPKIYNPQFNPVINALLTAIAQADDEVATQIQNGKDQIFIRTATGQNLNKAANSLGVSRPQSLGLDDPDFQELVPNLSLKPKQIKKAFYDTADVFWGPLFSRANATSLNFAPFDVLTGDSFSASVDNGPSQTVKALPGDIAVNGAATAQEIAAILGRIKGATTIVQTDSISGNQTINVRTNTPGSVGTIEVLDSAMAGSSKLNFSVRVYDILDMAQRVSVYNLNPHELIIEIPAIVPALRRTLKGSHHFHADATIASPQPPNNGIWAGSFLFDPSGSSSPFTLTSQKATLEQTLLRGQVYTAMTVNNSAGFLSPSGTFVLNFGMTTQEGPIRYRGIPNSNTILIDPSYVFKNDHFSGESANVVSIQSPVIPRRNGQDLAVYFTSPANSRTVVQQILDSLKAAGIIIHFVVLAPNYRYILDNPYLPEIEPTA